MKKVVIIGAGEGGKHLAAEILRCKKDLKIVGFLNDAKNLKNKKVLGVEILGPMQDLEKLASATKIDEVFIAIPSLRGRRLAKIVDLIQKLGLRFRILPGIFESIEYSETHQVPEGQLRRVELSDLLDREKVTIDIKEICDYLNNKTILIMGAGGSIGSELARRVGEFS